MFEQLLKFMENLWIFKTSWKFHRLNSNIIKHRKYSVFSTCFISLQTHSQTQLCIAASLGNNHCFKLEKRQPNL